MESEQIPYCIAMVLCDAAHRDPGTGKFTLLGTFGRIFGKEVPIPALFCVYFAITDGAGKMSVSLKIVDSATSLNDDESEEPIIQIGGEFDPPDRLAILEGVFGVAVRFPKPGVYHCELWVRDECLMSRRLVVTLIEKSEPPHVE